ncbi:MAG: SusD/RagB family nutrient-binding outer membrane lipoprotein [Bacteroidales bacterium]|nr:SusD/RagB family nutrient-binding outer membrane lipoprotein [Bacteroidales bacterium]
MKYLENIRNILLVTLFILGTGSCTKNFEEMNKSPNSPVDVPAINIFTNTIYSGLSTELGGWIQHTYLGCWCQQWTKIQYVDEDKYETRDMSGDFDGPYSGTLKNLTIVINKTTEEGDDKLLAAAKILRAWMFMYLTDLFGDVPYSEALQGFETDGIIKPVYDTQEDIYMALLDELDEANTLLTGTTVNFGSGDIMYGGDPVKWRKFANSLKLRLLNRCAGTPWSFTYDMIGTQPDVTTDPGAAAYAGADAEIATILSNPTQYPVFESNADNAKLVFPGLPYRNWIFNTLFARTDQGIAQTMVNWLEDRDDPRLHIYAQPISSSYDIGTGDYSGLDYEGFQNGSSELSATIPLISLLGTKIAYTETSPVYVMTYDEVQFIKAEHYLRVANDGAAQTAYETGIAASMARWGCNDGGTVSPSYKFGASEVAVLPVSYPVDYAAYLAHPLVDWDVAPDDAHKFQLINEQRWAAIFGQGVQAYSEIRRTGFPERIFEYELEATVYPDLGLPIRIWYSNNEGTYNGENLADAKSRQNIEASNEGMFSTNGIQSQMWWHTRKNPIPTETDEQVF